MGFHSPSKRPAISWGGGIFGGGPLRLPSSTIPEIKSKTTRVLVTAHITLRFHIRTHARGGTCFSVLVTID